jgi:uncharacterized membrane protein YdjX (TVP38/TMEM64 family)
MSVSTPQLKRKAKRYWPLGVAVLALIAGAVVWMLAPTADWIQGLSELFKRFGAAGPLIYFAIYVLGTLVLAPSPLLSIVGAAAFGWWGLPLAVAAGLTGATLAFLMSRHLFSETVEDWLSSRRRFKAALRAVDDEGWKILLPLRISPVVPFGPQNYLLGVTAVPLRTYVICTAIGIVPGNVADTYIGVIGVTAAQGNASGIQLVLLGAGLLATALVIVLITLRARAVLKEAGVT